MSEQESGGAVLPLRFTGSAGEYFKIWIVNIILSILTLGIYSAWAKVRTKRYFYGNTLLDDSPFEYHANPIAILKGRLIAVGALGVYSGSQHVSFWLQAALTLLLMVAVPWLLVRSAKFNAYNTSYRNLRFGFDGTYWDAAKVIIIPAVFVLGMTALSLYFAYLGIDEASDAEDIDEALGGIVGWISFVPFALMGIVMLMLPFWEWLRKRFVVHYHRYGTARFSFNASLGSFYKIYALALVGLIGGFIALIVIGTLVSFLAGKAAAFVAGIASIFLYLALFGYITSAITNKVFNGAKLSEHGFSSKLQALPLAWIYVSNAIAIPLSLGLLVPWAKVRMARYRIENLALLPASDLSEFVADTQANVSATGEELAEVFDVGFTL